MPLKLVGAFEFEDLRNWASVRNIRASKNNEAFGDELAALLPQRGQVSRKQRPRRGRDSSHVSLLHDMSPGGRSTIALGELGGAQGVAGGSSHTKSLLRQRRMDSSSVLPLQRFPIPLTVKAWRHDVRQFDNDCPQHVTLQIKPARDPSHGAGLGSDKDASADNYLRNPCPAGTSPFLQ